ncbi:MAG: hypothetical protein AAFV45_11850 [Pseudomonadota bacterium]
MFETNQRWAYRSPAGFEASRLVIGAIVSWSDEDRIICASVSGAPRREPDGTLTAVTIPFLPMTEEAFAKTVSQQDGLADPATGFADALREWSSDERGLSVFTVHFDGLLDQFIARQMAEIVSPASPIVT